MLHSASPIFSCEDHFLPRNPATDLDVHQKCISALQTEVALEANRDLALIVGTDNDVPLLMFD
jgi:hypothetical protein